MKALKKTKIPLVESIAILAILIFGDLINLVIYGRGEFLNIYYIFPILIGFFLNKKSLFLWVFFGVYVFWVFALFAMKGSFIPRDQFDYFFNLTIWMGFLTLVGALARNLSQKVGEEESQIGQLNKELEQKNEELDEVRESLEQSNIDFENSLTEKTAKLETSYKEVKTLKDKMESALNSIMDPAAVKMMMEGTLRNEKRRISVLFADLKDFTNYSDENPPEKVVEELNNYLKEMETCIQRYYGHVDKYLGDGIMAEFCAPINYRMHSLMAVIAGMSMQKKLLQIDCPWKMRIGIATGTSVVGLFGSKRKTYSCIGSTANLASRLENICEVGSIYIDEKTYLDVEPYVEAIRVHDFHGKRSTDYKSQEKIDRLRRDLGEDPYNQEKLFQLGQIYFQNRQATLAMECYENLLRINPDHTEAKLSFAEANLKKDEFEKLMLKGKKNRMAVYKIIGFYDPLQNRNKIPEKFYKKYHHILAQMNLPEDLSLRSELIDGSLHHGKLVATISFAMADHLGLSEKEKEDILIAGYLHDIGKESVSHEYLERPGKLLPNEHEELKNHSEESVNLIKELGYESDSIQKIILGHHENFDGSGYPQGLKGNDIPIGARILTVADAFDSMTGWRVYSEETWEYKSAILEIQKEANKGRYDPKCVEALIELMSD